MSYNKLLKESAERVGNISCMGIDPILEKMPPLHENVKHTIVRYYTEIFEAMDSEGIFPASVKPNIGYFEQYGIDGLEALQDIIETAGQYGIPIILDAKRGDIGRTAKAYAKAVFDFWGVDAVTVSPYMGSESVKPFTRYTTKGVYVLVKTSNRSANDLQELHVDGEPLFMKTADLVLKWGCGAVMGATYLQELRKVGTYFNKKKKEVPLLIPGVGSQGAKAHAVMKLLKSVSKDISLHRINSSSAINYAYLKSGSDDFAGEAVKALKYLNHETSI